MAEVVLDRIELEDVGANPENLASAIHDQLGDASGPVPVHAIARALDIVEIREERLDGFEGALVTTPERDVGSILLNGRSNRRRRRFTLGHELLHFLNAWHRPTAATGFWCTKAEMLAGDRKCRDRHLRQEAEANAFAIELLAPRRRLRRYLSAAPDLEAVVEMSEDLDISREAAARRYIALHGHCLAVVVGQDGRVGYVDRGEGFPWIDLKYGQQLPAGTSPSMTSGISDWTDTNPDDWFASNLRGELQVQVLPQRENRFIALLNFEAQHGEGDDALSDSPFFR